MRLWHQFLIPHLPRQQLLGQHRECCALRGKGWGRNHSVVNYVFEHEPELLVAYHYLVRDEMRKRGYKPDPIWNNPEYRGSMLGHVVAWADADIVDDQYTYAIHKGGIIYPEHDDIYLQECIDNLSSKGIIITPQD